MPVRPRNRPLAKATPPYPIPLAKFLGFLCFLSLSVDSYPVSVLPALEIATDILLMYCFGYAFYLTACWSELVMTVEELSISLLAPCWKALIIA